MYKGPQSKTVEYDFRASGLCTRDVLLYSGPSSRRSHVIRNIRPSYENIKTQLSFNLTLGRVIHCTFAQGIMSDVIGFGLDRCGTWPVRIHGRRFPPRSRSPTNAGTFLLSLRPKILVDTGCMDLDVRALCWEIPYKAAQKNVSLRVPWGPGKA